VSAPEFRLFGDDEIEYGRVDQVSPTIRRVIAENPSKFTYRGTGTYIVGRGDVVVIDPGPVLDSHRDALAVALRGERVRAILVTHCHADHSPLAAWLSAETGAPTVAHGPHPTPTEEELEEWRAEVDEGVKVEESVDLAFVPDVVVRDGDAVPGLPGSLAFTAVHTPGHTSNHTCYAYAAESALFTGDHVMGWSTTVVSPPDGDMAAYLASLEKVAARADSVLWPTHGPPRHDGPTYVRSLISHRRAREAQVLAAVAAGRATIPEIVELLYADVRPELHKAAGRSVLAHLVQLVGEGRVAVDGGGAVRRTSRFVSSET
jgi:glyoxylase-like metal-dependent hydrolase (beta-lactamase superfamily II)